MFSHQDNLETDIGEVNEGTKLWDTIAVLAVSWTVLKLLAIDP